MGSSAPPVPGGNTSAPSLPATIAPPPAPKTEIITLEAAQQSFCELIEKSDKKTFDLVRRQYFSEVADLATVVHVATICRDKQLDIFSKPFHVVTIKNKDYIWASIGYYRIVAHRTGEYVGLSEPTYGPEKEFKFKTKTVTAPEWCQITALRMVLGEARAFTKRVYYREQVVLFNGDPNDMWDRRFMGQMDKGAESASLRAAFPEVGQLPTIEEMEGREHDYSTQSVHAAPVDEVTGEVLAKSHTTPQQTEEQVKKAFVKPLIKGKQQSAAQPAAPAESPSQDDAGTTREAPQADAEQQGDKKESAPCDPPAAPAPSEPPPESDAEDVEIVDDVGSQPAGKDDCTGLLNMAKSNGWAIPDVCKMIVEKFKISSADKLPEELTRNQWKDCVDFFCEHKPGDKWE